MKTSELTGAALDWAVAKAEGHDYEVSDGAVLTGSSVLIQDGDYAGCHTDELYDPSTNWSQGGPIIERELIDVLHVRQNDLSVAWDATFGNDEIVESGPTLLIAAMRCYVASKLGDEVEIPEELCTK